MEGEIEVNKFKWLKVLLLVIILCFLVEGCKRTELQYNPSAPKKDVEISFWHTEDDPDLQDDIENIYNKTNKDGIHVQFKSINGNYKQEIERSLMSGNLPDCFTSKGIEMTTTLANGNHIEELTPRITDELKSKFIDGFLTVNKERVYGVIGSSYIRKVLYNADLFRMAGLDPDKPPRTLDELNEAIRIITKAGKGNFFGMALPMADSKTVAIQNIYRISSPSLGNIGGFFPDEGKFDFSRMANVIKVWRDLYKDKMIMEGSATLTPEQEAVLFSEGKLGMMIVTSKYVSKLGVNINLKYNFDLRSCDIPILGERQYRNIIEQNDPQVIAMTSRHKEAAWKFLIWLMSEERAKQSRRIAYSEIPMNKEIYLNQEKYFRKNSLSDLFKFDTNQYCMESQIKLPVEIKANEDNNNVSSKTDRCIDGDAIIKCISSDENIDFNLSELSEKFNLIIQKCIDNGQYSLDEIRYSKEDNPLFMK